MNEEHSSNQTETTKKSFFQSLIGRFFQGELKNREEHKADMRECNSLRTEKENRIKKLRVI